MNRVAAILIGVMLAVVPVEGTTARHDRGTSQPRISLDEAVAIARARVPGKVIGAESRERRGRLVHQVKILTPDGTVRVIHVDGETGRVQR